MKRLSLNPEPVWVEIDDDLSVCVRPLSAFDLAELFEDLDADKLSAGRVSPGEALTLVGRLAELAFVDWTVIGDDDARLPVSAEAARAMVRAEPELVAPLIERVLTPAVERAEDLAAEKNGSAPSPSGSSAGAKTTAKPAKAPARPVRRG